MDNQRPLIEMSAERPPSGYWRVLAEQRWFVIVFALSAALTAFALTYVYSEKYEASTAISYRVQEVTRFKAQQNEAVGSPAPQAPFKVIGQTLQDVLKSDAILEDIVRSLNLTERPTVPEGPWYRVWLANTRNWVRERGRQLWTILKYGRLVDEDPTVTAIAELRGNIKLTNFDSYIFQLSVRDRYPDRAAKIADQLGHVLAAWLLEFDRQPGRTRADQLRVMVDAKTAAIAQVRGEIQTLLAENHVASVPLEMERLTENLFALQLEQSRLRSEIARAQTRQSSVESKLALKQRILDSSAPPSEPAEYIPPEDFKKLASQHVFEGVDLNSLLAKQASLDKSIDSITDRLRKLPAIQTRLDSLKLTLASMERELTLLSDGYQEAAVRATSPVSEVRVLQPAIVPTDPVTPIKVYHVLLAGGLGLLFAAGLVYLLDFLDIRFLLAGDKPERHWVRTAGEVQAASAPRAPEDERSAQDG